MNAKQLTDKQWLDDNVTQYVNSLEGEFEAGAAYKPNRADWFAGRWSGLHAPADADSQRRSVDTGIEQFLVPVKTPDAVRKAQPSASDLENWPRSRSGRRSGRGARSRLG